MDAFSKIRRVPNPYQIQHVFFQLNSLQNKNLKDLSKNFSTISFSEEIDYFFWPVKTWEEMTIFQRNLLNSAMTGSFKGLKFSHKTTFPQNSPEKFFSNY